jgi:hypothetical protein
VSTVGITDHDVGTSRRHQVGTAGGDVRTQLLLLLFLLLQFIFVFFLVRKRDSVADAFDDLQINDVGRKYTFSINHNKKQQFKKHKVA